MTTNILSFDFLGQKLIHMKEAILKFLNDSRRIKMESDTEAERLSAADPEPEPD